MKLSNLPTPPKAILFDWDNTLVDSWGIIHKSLEHTFEQMGKEAWSLDEVKQFVGGSLREHFPKLFGDKWEEAGKHYINYYRSNNLAHISPLQGALQTVQLAQNIAPHTAVVSNKTGVTLRQEVAHIGWDKYFNNIVGAGDVARDKPSPDQILHVLKQANITPSKDVYMIGDSIVDIQAAKAAGISSIYFNGVGLPDTHKNIPASYVASHSEFH